VKVGEKPLQKEGKENATREKEKFTRKEILDAEKQEKSRETPILRLVGGDKGGVSKKGVFFQRGRRLLMMGRGTKQRTCAGASISRG